MRRAFVVVSTPVASAPRRTPPSTATPAPTRWPIWPSTSAAWSCPRCRRLGLGSILPLAGLPPAEAPVVHGRLASAGPGQGLDRRALGADGRRRHPAPADLPGRLPPEVIGIVRARQRPGCDLQPPRQRHRRRSRTSAPSTWRRERSSSTPARTRCSRSRPTSTSWRRRSSMRSAGGSASGMTGEHAVGRVIARPFAGSDGAFERTDGRRDFALAPPLRSYLQELQTPRRPGPRGGQGGPAVRRRRHRRRASRARPTRAPWTRPPS